MDGAISVILNINIVRPPHNLVLNQRFWRDLTECDLCLFETKVELGFRDPSQLRISEFTQNF